ncbi:MAG: hypothetical protein J3Q66DRAFT_46977 [Benniella sp.]|nr:MAG: hypothetical protein J3Q66DRAFT_46977 [Benniella sp.]
MVHFSGSDIVLFVIAAFLPPLAVLLKEGCGSELVISVALSILGFVPGVLYAWWVIYQGREDARTGQRIYQRPGAVPRRSYVIVAGEVPPNGAQPAPGVIHQYPGQPVVLKSPQGDEVQVLSREIQPSEGQGSGNGQQGSGQPSGQPAGGQPAGGQPADGQAAGGQPGGQQVVYVQGQPVAHDPTSTTETTRHVVEENGVKKTIIRTVKKTQRVVEVPAEAKIQDGQTVVVEHTD